LGKTGSAHTYEYCASTDLVLYAVLDRICWLFYGMKISCMNANFDFVCLSISQATKARERIFEGTFSADNGLPWILHGSISGSGRKLIDPFRCLDAHPLILLVHARKCGRGSCNLDGIVNLKIFTLLHRRFVIEK
jgi:hypothetical protein